MAQTLTEALGANNAPPTEGLNISGNVMNGVKAGVDLATAAEQVESQKTQLAEQKLKLDQSKFASFNGMMQTLNRATPQIAKAMAPQLKNRFQGMGFDPAIVDAAIADPEFGRAYVNMANALGGKVAANPEALGRALQSAQQIGELDTVVKNYGEHMKLQSEEKIAQQHNAAEIQKAKILAQTQVSKQSDKNLLASDRLYIKAVGPVEDLLSVGNKTASIISDIRSGGVTANPNIKADIEDTLSRLSSASKAATVSGSARHELDSWYGKIVDKLNKVRGSAEGIIAEDQLNELDRDVDAFNAVLGRQHEIAFKSFLAKQPQSSKAASIDGYNEIRKGYGFSEFNSQKPTAVVGAPKGNFSDNKTPAKDPMQVAKDAGYSQQEIDDFLANKSQVAQKGK